MTSVRSKEEMIYLTPAGNKPIPVAVDDASFSPAGFLIEAAGYFNKQHAWLTGSGREAISLLLKNLELVNEDEVYITTSFEFPNVSSCVTCTVFNYCKPSRVITEKTKAIFIIHEFGVPHPHSFDLVELGRKRGIPVIEDCAHTINSYFDNGQKTGAVADWTIVSFPKVFAVDAGGLLAGNKKIDEANLQDPHLLMEANPVYNQWQQIPEITARRREIFKRYKELLTDEGFGFLDYSVEHIMPWFFPLQTDQPARLLKSLQKNKIECGLWHGTNIVVLPLHQFLTNDNVDHICNILIQSR